ncbi:heme oxygenase-like protein [Wallemia mellicola]|nr:heme oxygenase-like protein [Wallemia mellicola]
MNTADIEQTPASKLLKSGTQIAHDLVAQSPTAVRLLSAQMPFSTFVKYTIWLHELYDTLEIAIQKNSSDPHLSPLSRLDVLARAPALKSDLTNLLSASTKEFQSEKGEQNWREHPFAEAVLKQLPPSLQTYRERIASADGLQLASHAYVRYLGDLSGGQIIQRKLGKAYMLEQLDAKQFYDFPPLDPSQEYPANAAEVKNIKNWFRKSLDIIAQSVEEKHEASKAFIFNSDMFIDLEKHSVTTPELSLPAEQSTTQTARIEQIAPADQTYLRIIFALLLILVIGYFYLK